MSAKTVHSKKIFWLKILIAFLLLSFIAFGLYVWYRPARDVQREEARTSITADSLFTTYVSNEKTANAVFLDKAVQVSGTIGSVSQNADGKTILFLQTADPMFGVNCTMEESSVSVKEGDQVTLKGICTGYTTDVILIRCYLK